MKHDGAAPARLGLLLTAYLAFIGLGLPDAVAGVAWPSIRESFGLGQGGLGLIIATAGAGYLLSSACSGLVMRALRLGDLLALSSLTVVLALAGYATTGSWPLFLACAALLGLAGGAIDAALNLFVATRFGPRQLNWLHAFYGLGASLGPLIMTAALASGWGWRAGVAAIGAALAPLTLLYAATRGAWGSGDGRPDVSAPADAASPVTLWGALARPAVWLQAAAFFTVTGMEATAGLWGYTLLTEQRGVGTTAAGLWIGAFWATFTLGRIAAGVVVDRVGSVRLMRLSALAAVAGSLLFAAAPTPVAGGVGLVLVGLAVAPLFPGLMAETPRRLGAGVAAHAVGLQISGAILGVATIPALAGWAAARFGLESVALATLGAGLVFLAINEALVATLDRGRPRTP